jgi:predicted nuclease of predicted toxin-antitoxin system
VTLWIDAQISPHLAPWIKETFGVEAHSISHLGMAGLNDAEIFNAARDAKAVVMTKDIDFVHLLERHGPPPSVIWITCGNTSNAQLRRLLKGTLLPVLRLIADGEPLVELTEID